MKYLFRITLIMFTFFTLGCERENIDETMEMFNEVPDPEIIIEEDQEPSFGINFSSSRSADKKDFIDGFGGIEPFGNNFFMEVVVRQGNTSGADPFILGWEHPSLNPGIGKGLIFYIEFINDNGEKDNISYTELTAGSLSVDLKDVGAVGNFMVGTFSGQGVQQSINELVDFTGSFKVLRGSCVAKVQVDEVKYSSAVSRDFTIESAHIAGRCLYISYKAPVSCTVSDTKMYDLGHVGGSNPPERFIRMVDESQSVCPSNENLELAFDVYHLRIEGEDKVMFTLDGWGEPLEFNY